MKAKLQEPLLRRLLRRGGHLRHHRRPLRRTATSSTPTPPWRPRSWQDYRRETGDEGLAVFASTASPYKFCDSVLAAIGEEPVSDSVDRIAQLQEVSGVPAPSRLAALKGKAPRFDGVADREEMEQVVLDFLK